MSPDAAVAPGPSAPSRDPAVILRSLGEGVHAVDAQGRITFANAAAAQMLGWDADELVGREQHAAIHHGGTDGDQDTPADCPVLATIRDGAMRRRDDEVFWRKDGTTLAVDYIATSICDGPDIVGAVVAFRDATQRRDDELTRMTQALARINRELDQFAYVASHDLKAPLRGIANLAQWIEEDTGDRLGPESRKHLALLHSRVRRMDALIDGLLQYSRARRLRNALETVDIGELLGEAVEMLNIAAPASVTIAPGMPALQTERVPLQQVFLNLLANALKHSGRPDTRVVVRAQDAGDFYEFAVADNGRGIARPFHAKVWEVFQTLQPRDRVEGTGLGLALVKKHVEGHGGRAWLESDEGRGATFHFTWPKRFGQEG